MENKALLIFELELWMLGLEFVIFIGYWWNDFSYIETEILCHSWGYSVHRTQRVGEGGGEYPFSSNYIKENLYQHGYFSYFIF